jgi:hypothetical protein
MESSDETKNLEKGTKGQIHFAWISSDLAMIDGFGLLLWILDMEKFTKHLANHSSVDGMESGLGTLNYSWEGYDFRPGTGCLFVSGFGESTKSKGYPSFISSESEDDWEHDRFKLD